MKRISGLNEIYTYVKSIFDQDDGFLEQSKNIATHLQSASQHPNIKGGELFIGLFENCMMPTGAKKVLAIVKIDEKELFLDVKNEENKLVVNGIDGINTKKINNMAVIVDMGADEAQSSLLKQNEKKMSSIGKSVF